MENNRHLELLEGTLPLLRASRTCFIGMIRLGETEGLPSNDMWQWVQSIDYQINEIESVLNERKQDTTTASEKKLS